MTSHTCGSVYGYAGRGLRGDTAWAANDQVVQVGLRGEIATEEVLNSLAALPGGPSVIHDLTIPGSSANVDHAVVAGTTVYLIDSKRWAPGTFWRTRKHTYRGTHKFPAASKRTLNLALSRVRDHLDGHGVRGVRLVPIIAIWPTRKNPKLRLWPANLMRADLARMVPADILSAMIGRSLPRPADPRVVAALVQLTK